MRSYLMPIRYGCLMRDPEEYLRCDDNYTILKIGHGPFHHNHNS